MPRQFGNCRGIVMYRPSLVIDGIAFPQCANREAFIMPLQQQVIFRLDRGRNIFGADHL